MFVYVLPRVYIILRTAVFSRWSTFLAVVIIVAAAAAAAVVAMSHTTW
jgi:hypothetical protein